MKTPALLLLFAIAAHAEAQFEVASVKVSPASANGVRGGCHGIDSVYTPAELGAAPPLGRCRITDGRLSHLIGIAYTIPMQSVRNAPDWVIAGSERYSIEAKAEDPSKTTEKELLAMLQALLEDRFKLKFHRETKDEPGFVLTVAKGGSKLPQSKSADPAANYGAGKSN